MRRGPGRARREASPAEAPSRLPPGARADPLAHDQRRARRPSSAGEALRRRRYDRRIGGVAGGIADFVGAHPAAVRAIFAASVPLSLGLTAVGYLLLWLLIPVHDAA